MIEKMIDRVRLNTKRFGKQFISAIAAISFIASLVLLIFDKEDFGIKELSCKIICIVAILVVSTIYALFRTVCYRKVIVKEDNPLIKVQYGDLWKKAFPKKKSEKRIVAINVNTTFDVIVDESVADIPKPLVSPTTMHGQLIKKLKEREIAPEALSKKIKENLQNQCISPVRSIERSIKPRGELDCYEKGTIAIYEYENTIFYLLAFSEFDENNNAQNSKDEMVKTVTKLINFYNENGQGYEMFVPLMGVGMSRTGISESDSLKILSSLFDIHNDKLQGNVTIIVYEKDRDKVSIDV